MRERQLSAENSYANPLKTLYELQWRRNETYRLGIVLRWTDGARSRVYPLVGRRLNHTALGTLIDKTQDAHGRFLESGQWDSMPMPQDNDIYEQGAQTPAHWQAFNTAFVVGNDNPGTLDGPAMYGEFAYTESEERYPNDPRIWGEDAGQPIRDFRMPDLAVAPLIDGEDALRSDADPVATYRLGLRFLNIEEVMASLPAEVRAEMDGWELVRCDRRNQKTVLASGLLYNMFYQNWADQEEAAGPSRNWLGALGGLVGLYLTRPGRDSSETVLDHILDDVRLYPNYPFNDLRPDPYINAYPIAGDTPNPAGNDRYRRDVFTFLSPDTSFNRNLLFQGELMVHQEVFGVGRTHASFLRPFPALKDVGDDSDDVAFQFTSLAHYNAWKKVVVGNQRRLLKECMYVPFSAQVPGGAVGLPVHNLMRESSVLVHTQAPLTDPTVLDSSRTWLRDSDFDCRLSVRDRFRTVSAYYVSLVSRLPNQYGSIFDGRYCSTNYDSSSIRNHSVVFGGDCYLSRMSAKRQMVYYQNLQSFKDWEDGRLGVDLKTSENIFSTHYYYFAGRRNTNKDSLTQCESSNRDLGFLPCIHAGVPLFWCESDYNLDLRVNGAGVWETHYPNLKDGALTLDQFLGVEHLDKDNHFALNASYEEVNDLMAYEVPDPFFDPDNLEETHYSTRVIYSLQTRAENRFNNLLQFLPLNYYDFQRDAGALVDIRDIGGYRTLFRLEHALYLDRLYQAIDTAGANARLGNGRLFAQEPTRVAKTDGGYAGTSSQWAFNNTPFGAFFLDYKRREVFQYGEALNSIANGLEDYFQRELTCHLLEDLPFFQNPDNPQNPEGVGFHSVWDAEAKLWLLTKRDYELLDKTSRGLYSQRADGVLLRDGQPVSLNNPQLFRNRSFTLSYNPRRGRWSSWHSFLPLGYFELANQFYSLRDHGIWRHDGAPRSYYGTVYPFVFEGILKGEELGNRQTHSLEFTTRCFRAGVEVRETFNKCWLYNLHQSTGELHLVQQDENDLSSLIRFELTGPDFKEAFLRRSHSSWGLAALGSYLKDPTQPLATEAWEELKDRYFVDKLVNHNNHDYNRSYQQWTLLNDLWVKYRLTYDKADDVQLYLYLTGSLAEASTK